MRLAVRHVTRYEFAQPVAHGLQRLRLTPKSTHGQRVLSWTMTLSGAGEQVVYDDHNHNRTQLVSVEAGTKAVEIVCDGVVETADQAGVLGQHSGHMPLWAFVGQSPLTKPGARIRAIIAQLDSTREAPLPLLHELSARIIEAVPYATGETGVNTTGEEAAALGSGVCQDHAHIFIGAARSLGIPARYVSGYLMMNDRIHQQAGHAWAEAHVENLGWVAFDVSNGISPDARYIRVATGRDYREAAPVTGLSWGAGETALTVELAVEQQRIEQ